MVFKEWCIEKVLIPIVSIVIVTLPILGYIYLWVWVYGKMIEFGIWHGYIGLVLIAWIVVPIFVVIGWYDYREFKKERIKDGIINPTLR